MTFFKPKSVLLVDHQSNRAKAIAAILKKKWTARVTIAKCAVAALQATENHAEPFDVVIVAFGAGNYRQMLRDLYRAADTTLVLITDNERCTYPSDAPRGFRAIIPVGIDRNDSIVIETIREFMGSSTTPLPMLPSLRQGRWPRALVNQVTFLDSGGDPSVGKEILQHLVLQLHPEISKFTLIQLGQGFSGASVFRLAQIEHGDAKSSRDLVLKLTPSARYQSYKCRHEVANHDQIQKSFNNGLVKHVPDLNVSKDGKPAEYKGWLAVTYECVTHENLCVADLERLAIEPGKCLAKVGSVNAVPSNQLMGHMLQKLFNLLERWYTNDKSRMVTNGPLWTEKDAPNDSPPMFPPYRFTSWEKEAILDAMDQLDLYGKSLLAADWKLSRRQVMRLISTNKALKFPAALITPQPLLLSRVHGDLNANNVLFELYNELVQFIDFACFQEQGHLVQDFARLEVAIKIELMGREVDGPAGRDLNTAEFGHWCEAEKWLQSWPDESTAGLDSTGISLSARRTFELCALIRRSAEGIHSRLAQKCKGEKPDFQLSYEAALLYHTVRSIRFASRPHLKRIFSVYSARLLADRLDSVGRARKKR